MRHSTGRHYTLQWLFTVNNVGVGVGIGVGGDGGVNLDEVEGRTSEDGAEGDNSIV